MPEEFIDDCRMVKLTLIYDRQGIVRPEIAERFPNGVFIDDFCPHFMEWYGPTPRDWMKENLTGYAIRWKTGFHFNIWADAFAFKMRWL